MECPRCEGGLDAFTLEGREAVICRDCGYVGIDTDHAPEPTHQESWSDALRRFHEKETDDKGDAEGK